MFLLRIHVGEILWLSISIDMGPIVCCQLLSIVTSGPIVYQLFLAMIAWGPIICRLFSINIYTGPQQVGPPNC